MAGISYTIRQSYFMQQSRNTVSFFKRLLLGQLRKIVPDFQADVSQSVGSLMSHQFVNRHLKELRDCRQQLNVGAALRRFPFRYRLFFCQEKTKKILFTPDYLLSYRQDYPFSNIFSLSAISSGSGSISFMSSGNELLSWYVATPIGTFERFRAYST